MPIAENGAESFMRIYLICPSRKSFVAGNYPHNWSARLDSFFVFSSAVALWCYAFISILPTGNAVSKSTPEIERMVRDIEYQVPLVSGMLGRDTPDRRVIAAMRKVPRHEFVPASAIACAYDDGPLPIGCGQTISQPFIVALMTDLLHTRPSHVVLEVGTGSGYQAAILSHLVKRVYSTEIHCELADRTRERLDRLACRNVEVRCGDGYYGWHELAPFDGIIVTAAAPHVPPPLVEQLKPGGASADSPRFAPFSPGIAAVAEGVRWRSDEPGCVERGVRTLDRRT